MSKTKQITREDVEDLRAHEKAARQRVADAQTSLRIVEKHNDHCSRWRESWQRENPDNTGEPVWADDLRADGRLQNGRQPDVPISSPVPEERIEEIRTELDKAEKAHAKATADLESAVSGHEPRRPSKPTGFVAGKAKVIDGISYEIGDAVSVAGLSDRKVEALVDQRVLRKVGA